MDSTIQPPVSAETNSADAPAVLPSSEPSQPSTQLATDASLTDAASSQQLQAGTEPSSQTQAESSAAETSPPPTSHEQPAPLAQSIDPTVPETLNAASAPVSAPTSAEPAASTSQSVTEASTDDAKAAAGSITTADVAIAIPPANESSASDSNAASSVAVPPSSAAPADALSADANAESTGPPLATQVTTESTADNPGGQSDSALDSVAKDPTAPVSIAEPAASTVTLEPTAATALSSTQPLDALSTTAGSNSTEAKGGELVSSSTEQGKVAETGTASADAPASAVAEASLAAPEADVTADPISSTSAGTTADTTAKSAEGTAAGEADSVGVSAAAETNQLPLVANAPQAGTNEGASSKAAATAGPATGNDPSASVAETAKEPEAKTKDAETGSEDTETAEPASSASVIAPNETAAASAPATPDKKSKTDDAPAGPTSSLQPSTPVREGRVALILRINKELIRLCVELQSKELVTDPVYREAAVRLQANLGYLAGIADKSGKPNDPNRPSAPSAALLKLEPFPRSEHVPSSPLPALYDKLISIFGAARSVHSPTADGKKRSRDSTADLGSEDARKRAASKGIDRSQDVSAAGTPTSSSNMQTGSFQPADVPTATAPSNADPSSTSAVPNQVPQQQPQPQQQGKGPDLSLAPPVPIAPPAAAQNIPNNPQAQALMQAFGPNALVNLHALQTHLRGQGTHPWVAFMEANVSGFKAMSLQVQLQHMTSLQNAAQQRQKAMQAGGGGPGSAGPNSGIGSPATMMPNGGMGGAVSSPANTRPVSRHSDSPSQAQASPSASGLGVNVPGQTPGRTGTPLGGQAPFQNRPGSSGSVGSMTSAGGRTRTGSSHLAFDPSQMQSAPSPATMATVTDFAGQQQGGMPFGFQPPGLQQPSPASASSPSQQGQPQQPQQQQQQQGQQGMAPGMMMGGMGMNMPNFQNLPPHLQQQIRQQYMAHLQAQAQAQGMNPQSGFNLQQQQQQQPQQQQGWNFQSPQ